MASNENNIRRVFSRINDKMKRLSIEVNRMNDEGIVLGSEDMFDTNTMFASEAEAREAMKNPNIERAKQKVETIINDILK